MLTCAQFQIDPLTFHATLTDFGLSRIMSGTMVCSTRTMMAGTPGFQSPEQLQAKNIGLPTDVYAFGCVMIVIFSEQSIWPELTPFQIMVKVTVDKDKPSALKVGNKEIKELCESCTDATRPSIEQVLQTLQFISL